MLTAKASLMISSDMSQANSPVTYSAFTIFESVNTVYGPGYVAEIREKDYVVKLANWALAQGQSPTLYLGAEALR